MPSEMSSPQREARALCVTSPTGTHTHQVEARCLYRSATFKQVVLGYVRKLGEQVRK